MRVILKALRVRQWTKNLLVFAAPGAAGVLTEADILVRAIWAFAAFSLLSSSLYVVNDLRDIEEDRLHPRKKLRPFASGALSPSTGLLLSGTAALGSALIAVLLLPTVFVWVMVAYALNTLTYAYWGKKIPTLDVMQVALGFVLRAVAGGFATGVTLSQWFLAAAMFGSLLMVAGKRASEVMHVGDRAGTRSVLVYYSTDYLRQIMVIAAGALLLTYAMWALGDSEGVIDEPWAIISFAPFVYAVLRYVQLSDAGEAEEPERLVLTDTGLQAGGFVWVVLIATGIYA